MSPKWRVANSHLEEGDGSESDWILGLERAHVLAILQLKVGRSVSQSTSQSVSQSLTHSLVILLCFRPPGLAQSENRVFSNRD